MRLRGLSIPFVLIVTAVILRLVCCIYSEVIEICRSPFGYGHIYEPQISVAVHFYILLIAIGIKMQVNAFYILTDYAQTEIHLIARF